MKKLNANAGKNPFIRETLFQVRDLETANQHFFKCVKVIPSIDDKNAQLIVNCYKSKLYVFKDN